MNNLQLMHTYRLENSNFCDFDLFRLDFIKFRSITQPIGIILRHILTILSLMRATKLPLFKCNYSNLNRILYHLVNCFFDESSLFATFALLNTKDCNKLDILFNCYGQLNMIPGNNVHNIACPLLITRPSDLSAYFILPPLVDCTTLQPSCRKRLPWELVHE